MLNPSVRNERGERLLAIHDAAAVPASAAFVVVIATHCGRVLLVHNRVRGVWELPGGFVDAGETAEACARRELSEESGQTAGSLTRLADIVIERRDGSLLHGGVFSATLDRRAEFQANAEIDAIGFWKDDELPHPFSAIDACLVQRLA